MLYFKKIDLLLDMTSQNTNPVRTNQTSLSVISDNSSHFSISSSLSIDQINSTTNSTTR